MNTCKTIFASLGIALLGGCYHDREPEYRVVEQPVVVVPYQPEQYYVYGGSYYYWHPEGHYYVRLREPPRGEHIRYERVEHLPPPPHGHPAPRPPNGPGQRP